jgi:putative transcriptional regulator
MSEAEYLAGRLLLAMPGMGDPRFERSVNVLCVHDEHGALGVGIGPGDAPDREVHHGGPVEPGRGFVLHSTDWGGVGTLEVAPLCALSASLDVLRAIAEGRGPSRWLMALGYAGWGPGQLDGEMRHHGWYAAEGREEIVFDTPVEKRWTASWKAEGIDPALLANVTGSA